MITYEGEEVSDSQMRKGFLEDVMTELLPTSRYAVTSELCIDTSGQNCSGLLHVTYPYNINLS